MADDKLSNNSLSRLRDTTAAIFPLLLTIFIHFCDDGVKGFLLDPEPHHVENLINCFCPYDSIFAEAIETFHEHWKIAEIQSSMHYKFEATAAAPRK